MEDWLEIWRGSWLHEAQFLKSVLEGSGIEAQIPDEHMLGTQPHLTIAVGECGCLSEWRIYRKRKKFLNPFHEATCYPD